MNEQTRSEFLALFSTALDDGIIGYYINKFALSDDMSYLVMLNKLMSQGVNRRDAMSIVIFEYLITELRDEILSMSAN
jgi:hypothetical protein